MGAPPTFWPWRSGGRRTHGPQVEEAPRTAPPDGQLVVAAAVLVGLGVVMIYSATALMQPGHAIPPYFLRQVSGVLAGVALAAAAMHVPLHVWRRAALPLWLVSVGLVAATLELSREVNGARRWLEIPGLGVVFQPVELAKFASVLLAATLLGRRRGWLAQPGQRAVAALLVALVPAALLVEQPDLGNAVILVALVGFLLFAAGLPLGWFALGGVAASVFLALYALRNPYTHSRIFGFVRPWELAEGDGFQLVQSFVAFGRGALWGVGVGNGRQQLFYLPEAHTDFILAVVAEELGVVGVLVVLGAFAALGTAGLRIARRARDLTTQLSALGMALLLALPAGVNAAVVTGLLPTKGLGLPFLSYGRSGLVTSFLALGVLLAIGRREAAPERRGVGSAERRGSLRP